MFRKQVKCCDCGFLALHEGIPPIPMPLRTLEDFKTFRELGLYGSHECTQRGRDHIANGTHSDLSILTCTRHIWSGSDFKGKPKEAIFEILNSQRKCPYFFQYTAGYSPIEHMELQREAKTHRLLIRGMIWAAVIGAVAAIAGQLIAR